MARGFNFRLQRLLELRRLRERESARRVSVAQRAATEAEGVIETLAEVRRASASELASAHGAARSVGELQRVQLLLTQLDQHIAEADARLNSAQKVVAERVEEYTAAARMRHVLDRLRDRQRDLWRSASVHAEQKEIDEIAVQRHHFQQPGVVEA